MATRAFHVADSEHVDRPNTGGRGSYEKLADRLAACAPLDVASMAEVFWILQLCRRILETDEDQDGGVHLDHEACDSLAYFVALPADPCVGGPWQRLPRLQQLSADGDHLCGGSIHCVRREALLSELLLKDTQGFAKWLETFSSSKGRQLYATLCHVLFPDSFERILS